MNPRKSYRMFFGVLCFLLITTVATSGCSTLKKKFTRQKKKDRDGAEQFVPVLEPEEYPEKLHSPTGDYEHHYSLWQVWHKELSTAVFEKQGPKKLVFDVDQAILQVDALKGMLSADKQAGMEGVLVNLRKVRSALDQPAVLRDDTNILNELRRIERNMRNNYSLKAVEASLNK